MGTKEEVLSNVLGIAPKNVKHGVHFPSAKLGNFLNGNHEMYSRGYGYYDHLLPYAGLGSLELTDLKSIKTDHGQYASYMMLENDYWRIIGLDTGYNSYNKILNSRNYSQPTELMNWLINDVQIGNKNDTRGIIFFTSSNYFFFY